MHCIVLCCIALYCIRNLISKDAIGYTHIMYHIIRCILYRIRYNWGVDVNVFLQLHAKLHATG